MDEIYASEDCLDDIYNDSYDEKLDNYIDKLRQDRVIARNRELLKLRDEVKSENQKVIDGDINVAEPRVIPIQTEILPEPDIVDYHFCIRLANNWALHEYGRDFDELNEKLKKWNLRISTIR